MMIVPEQFTDTKTAVSTDERGRIALGSGAKDTIYNISSNEIGQILLTPVVMVPAHELWLLKNPQAMAAIQQGLADAAAGRVTPLDWSKYPEVDMSDVENEE